jgi:hypothetical protein
VQRSAPTGSFLVSIKTRPDSSPTAGSGRTEQNHDNARLCEQTRHVVALWRRRRVATSNHHAECRPVDRERTRTCRSGALFETIDMTRYLVFGAGLG